MPGSRPTSAKTSKKTAAKPAGKKATKACTHWSDCGVGAKCVKTKCVKP